MNFCNLLTISRLILTILFVITISSYSPFLHILALILFLLASITDWLDGYLARRYELCTNFGRLMDPLADKILVSAALICLISLNALPAWVVVIVISREFLITGLRLLALDQKVLLSADQLGKQKTTWQLVTILFYLFLLTIKDFSLIQAGWMSFCWNIMGPIFITIMLSVTIISGVGYLWRNRKLMLR